MSSQQTKYLRTMNFYAVAIDCAIWTHDLIASYLIHVYIIWWEQVKKIIHFEIYLEIDLVSHREVKSWTHLILKITSLSSSGSGDNQWC